MRAGLSLLLLSARLTLRTLPTLGSVSIVLVRVVVVPVATGLFYLALATGAGVAPVSLSNVLAAGAAVGGMTASVSASTLITLDRFEGTLTHVMLASNGRIATWAGRIATLVGLGIVNSFVVTAVGLLVVPPQNLAPSQWASIPLVLLIAACSGSAVGVMLGALGLGLRDSLLPSNVAEFLLPLACGVVAPLTVFPPLLQSIVSVVPITPAITAARAVADDDLVGVIVSGSVSLGTATVWLGVASALWWVLERRARTTGASDLTPL